MPNSNLKLPKRKKSGIGRNPKGKQNDHHTTTMRHGPPWVCPQMQVLLKF